jgi:hypothetical protein
MVADDEKYHAAKARVGEIRRFYTRLIIFVIVNVFCHQYNPGSALSLVLPG